MSAVTLKCPSCGGDLRFDPDSQQYKCEYCLSQFTEVQMDQQLKEKESPLLYSCPSCGAEIVTDDTTSATFCYYCHNPVLLSGRLQGDSRPDFIIPFAVDKEKATQIFTQWIGQKRLIPKAFFAKEQIEKLTGVYFPYWTYSCHVEGSLQAEGRKLRTWTSGNMRCTETSRYQVERNGSMEISHVPRNALKKANKQLVEGVFPYEIENSKPFSMGYLSGFQAENRDRQKDEFISEVEQEVQGFVQGALKAEAGGYDSLSITSQDTRQTAKKWSYALFPVWTLTYKGRDGEIYYFACNGQTGKICGKLPVDQGRLGMLFLTIFVPVLIALLIVGWLI